jgi:hypothetical protein
MMGFPSPSVQGGAAPAGGEVRKFTAKTRIAVLEAACRNLVAKGSRLERE